MTSSLRRLLSKSELSTWGIAAERLTEGQNIVFQMRELKKAELCKESHGFS